MNKVLIPVYIPKETVSDDHYRIMETGFHDGDKIAEGDIIASVETSKNTVDIESPSSGYVFYDVTQGEEVKVGSVFALISEKPRIPKNAFDLFVSKTADTGNSSDLPEDMDDTRISKTAMDLIREHEIDPAVFRGKPIVRKEDVLKYLEHISVSSKTNPIDFSDNSIIIIGGGGHAKMCIDMLRQVGTYEIAGVVDDAPLVEAGHMGVGLLGNIDSLSFHFEMGARFAALGIGALSNPIFRKHLFDKAKGIGYEIPNLIHPSAIIEPSVTMGTGNQIMAGAIIGSNVKLGNNCIINSGSVISHDSALGDNVHITPGAILAGIVQVGDNSVIGMGASIMFSTRIGNNVVISNGLNVFNDVPDGTILKH